MTMQEKIIPMLKSVEEMSKFSGIGARKLLSMIHSGEIDYIKNGNRFLLADKAIWDWYERNKIRATQ
jgi:excisionase family DNA binding protein